MRKAVIVATIIVALIVVGRAWNAGGTPTATPESTEQSPASPQQPTPPRPSFDRPATSQVTTTPSASGGDRARQLWEPVVEGFALAYTATQGRTTWEWLANIKPYCDEALFDDLTHTRLRQVPAGRYSGYTVLKQGEETLTVRVVYHQGWALVLYIRATSTTTYVIDRLDRTEDFD